jgi:adenosylhomocysteine nucleosidase
MLAVVGAMKEEIDLLSQEMTGVTHATRAGIEVASGQFQGTEIVLARCGIGKVNAAICTQMLIDHHEVDGIIFSGVAGGLLPNMRPGDLMIASYRGIVSPRCLAISRNSITY